MLSNLKSENASLHDQLTNRKPCDESTVSQSGEWVLSLSNQLAENQAVNKDLSAELSASKQVHINKILLDRILFLFLI